MPRVIYKFGDDISTDLIYPGRYMATVLPSETPQYAFADETELNELLNSGNKPEDSVIIAGKNFGCGSSREQAASSLKGHNVTVIAKHFSRIFLQNSINLGLNVVICPDLEAQKGDELDITDTNVFNKTSGFEYEVISLPQARKAIIDAGGLIAYTRKKLIEERG